MKKIIDVSLETVNICTHTRNLNEKIKYENSNKSLFKKTGSCYYFLCLKN